MSSSKKIQQEIAKKIQELRRTCCEDADRSRPAIIDELSMHQERNLTTVSQLFDQIRELQNKVREFHDPESGGSSGATHVPSQPSTILSSGTLPRCDSGLARDTQNCTCLQETFFERPLAQEGLSSTILNILSGIGT